MSQITKQTTYNYSNLSIPGGGYVTGFVYHANFKDILYCRTDIGGIYRYNYQDKKWICLSEHVSHLDMSETFPLAIALDPKNPGTIHMASGLGHPFHDFYPNGYFSTSKDYGKTWTKTVLPCHVHGNNPGRGTGLRMVVDPNNSEIIYFASQTAGLLKTLDEGKTWSILNVATVNHPKPETNLTFVWVAPDSRTVVVGADGSANTPDPSSLRSHSLFISRDGGESFTELTQPEHLPEERYKLKGYVGHRYDFDGKYFYVTMNQTGPGAYIPSYSCDCGDVSGGRIIRYSVDENYNLSDMTDISPVYPERGYTGLKNASGFGGICSTPEIPGYIVASSLCNHAGDLMWESRDYGKTWKVILEGLKTGGLHFNASYMKPEYNGNHSLLHWLSDVKINPFNSNELFFNSGTGAFGTDKLQDENRDFYDICQGIEETVHLNLYAPTKGDIIALDIVGDLGGFVFTQTQKPCENSFADEKGDRYITSLNADYADEIPNTFIATPRGNWTRKTKGGLVFSSDAGKTLTHISNPFGINQRIDALLTKIETPNVNSGWVALSSDAKAIVWSIADNYNIPADAVVYSTDCGLSFKKSSIIPLAGANEPQYFKAYSDRVNPNVFYGFGEDSRLYVSTDRGANFYEKNRPKNFPIQTLTGIDAQMNVEIRGISGEEGAFLLAMNVDGLYQLNYNYALDTFTATKLTKGNDAVYCVGLGILPNSTDFIKDDKAIYMCATIEGQYGFYRSLDWCKTYEKINNDHQLFGEIKSIDGDKLVFGRYFIATGSFGLKMGVEA